MDRLARALRLVDAFRRQGTLRTRDVMRILEVERKAALRTLETLRDAGVPIRPVGEGRNRRWEADPSWRRSGLSVSRGDAVALHFGRQMLQFVEGTLFSTWYDDLRAKLEVGTSGPTADFEDRFARRVVFVSEPYRRYSAVDDVLDEVLSALLAERELALEYGDPPRRWTAVRPLALVVYRRALYLLCQLWPRGKVFRLAVDRIRSAARTEQAFDYPRDFDVQAELARTFGIFDDGRPPAKVRMRFAPAVAEVVASRVWHETARIEREPTGHVVLTLRATGLELARLALEFGGTVEVLEPDWLRAEVVRELEAALALYRDP